MIKYLFLDIDETLIHSILLKEEGFHTIEFELSDGIKYYTKIRPCAKDLIEYSNNLVGKDNVYILTTSTRDYANTINKLAGWGLESDHIITREDISNHQYPMAYSGTATYPHKLADKNNVLVDNLPPRYNWSKIALIGIEDSYPSRYLQIYDYYGVDYPDDSFENDVKEFLQKCYENDYIHTDDDTDDD